VALRLTVPSAPTPPAWTHSRWPGICHRSGADESESFLVLLGMLYADRLGHPERVQPHLQSTLQDLRAADLQDRPQTAKDSSC
jgi:hypothetical protein